MQGKTISGYTLQRLLGTGGMAEVWYAESKIGSKAAVKIMSEKLSYDDSMRERFLNEAKVMVVLDHPNIRKVYGFDEIIGRPAIVMEYLEGSDLKARMKGGQRFTQEELEKWWNQLADALNYTHAQDIIHRDIKPSNIFIDQWGNAKLLDFGIAKVADTTNGTQTGSTLGTRIYMSPEQVRDPKRVGPPSDVYSLAVSFVHLLTGKAPYDSTNCSDYDIQESIVRKPVDMSKVPDTWRGFLLPYLEKDPAKRPALRLFEVVPLREKPKKASSFNPPTDNGNRQSTSDNDEGTIAARSASNTITPDESTLASHVSHSETVPISNESTGKRKSKKWLWIGLGTALALLVAILLFVVPQGHDDAEPLYPEEDDVESPYSGYKMTKNGLYYRFYNKGKGETPQIDDLLDVGICCYVEGDTVISYSENTMQLLASQFAGDLYEGLAMMHVGDSASFIVNIDSTFVKMFGAPNLPEGFKSTDVMRIDVRLDSFYPESEYASHLNAKVKKNNEARVEKLKRDYPEETSRANKQLSDYMLKNHIDVNPTKSGLCYVKKKEGNGEKPSAGQTVSVHYTGRLLDGTVFDSSYDRGEPIVITIGVGQVIPGWDEGILLMSKGEKGVLYIPNYLAYGDKQAGDMIAPFSNLIFEVELIDFE